MAFYGIDPFKRFSKAVVAGRFWYRGTPCWLWTGHTVKGYGSFSVQAKEQYVHRWSHERWIGPIPAGFHVDHLCREPLCANPFHLEAVTPAENLRRSRHAHRAQTHCKHGHPFDEMNTRVRDGGRRECRSCAARRSREYLARKKAVETT